ncbi:MAG: hypothetical protein PHO32_07785, partial [Candidatus Cloacimonetes bacterium]|nr:hypothetical protein [Candidatus Cloacimonadota bacterium]
MKKLVFVLLLGLLCLTLFAQTPVLLRNAQYLGFDGVKVQMPNSSMMIFWNDTSTGNSDIYAQKLSSDGNPLWESPRAIVSNPIEQRIIAAEATSDGNIVILYSEYSPEYTGLEYFVQKLSMAGQILWSPSGLQINSYSWSTNVFSILPNNIGGMYVVYPVSNPIVGYSIMNLNANGINQWPSSIIYPQSSLTELDSYIDGSGGIIVKSRSWISGEGYCDFLLRINDEGDLVGTNPLLSPSTLVPQQFDMLRSSDGNYFLYLIENNVIQLQKMDAMGNLLFPEIVSLSIAANQVYINGFEASPSTDGGVYVTTLVSSGNYINSLHLYKVNSAAQMAWQNHTEINSTTGISRFNLAVSPNNEVWLSWMETIDPSNYLYTNL